MIFKNWPDLIKVKTPIYILITFDNNIRFSFKLCNNYITINITFIITKLLSDKKLLNLIIGSFNFLRNKLFSLLKT